VSSLTYTVIRRFAANTARNSEDEIPNPKQTSMTKKTKSKTPTYDPAQEVWSIGIWSFGFVWDLVFRAWCFGCGFAG
jgi:hypothetical protein